MYSCIIVFLLIVDEDPDGLQFEGTLGRVVDQKDFPQKDKTY